MKIGTWLLLLGSLGLTLYLARRRLRLALLIGGGLYAAITLVRFVGTASDPDRLDDLALTFGGFAVIWLALWGVNRYRAYRRARAKSTPRIRGA